jgi:NarL family two-component system response regulator LiaR
MIRLLIVDDHAVVRQGLSFLCGQEPDIDVVGECATGALALSMARATQPDVVLLDLFLPDRDGLAVLAGIGQTSPGSRVVMLTSSPEDSHLIAAVHAGATSYLLKTTEITEVLTTIRAAARGESVLPPTATTKLLNAIRGRGQRSDPYDRLTPRELDVLAALARGQANREIARNLLIGEETVKSHVSSILTKLGLADRTQAALYALRRSLNRPEERAELTDHDDG